MKCTSVCKWFCVSLFFLMTTWGHAAMHFKVCSSKKMVGKAAAHLFAQEVIDSVEEEYPLGFIMPTGSSPLPMYSQLLDYWKKGWLDLSKIHLFNMDEYIGIDSRDPNSYHTYMREHFWDLVCNHLTEEKLKRMGLQVTLQEQEVVVSSFRRFLAQWVNREKVTPLFLLDQTLPKPFSALTVFMDGKVLPTKQQLYEAIEQDISLWGYGLQLVNCWIPSGQGGEYKEALRAFQARKESRLVAFGGIGRGPAHIAFNDFIEEPPFNSNELSEEEKTLQAFQTGVRIVPLAEGTRKSNRRFFEEDLNRMPTHAITIGIKDLVSVDRICILVSGKSKQQSLLDTLEENPPSYRVPASLLKQFSKGDLEWIVDQEAAERLDLNQYGAVEEIFFYPEFIQKEVYLAYNSHHPRHLDEKSFHFPQLSRVLWVKGDEREPSLIQKLKDRGCWIYEIPLKETKKIKAFLRSWNPEWVTFGLETGDKEKRTSIQRLIEKFAGQSVMGIAYESSSEPPFNYFVHFDKDILEKKIKVLQQFHQSQVKRSPLDLITQEMAVHYQGEPFLFPDSFESFKKSSKVLVVAPHPDDAEIAAGALLQKLHQWKISVEVWNLTSGNRAEMDIGDLVEYSTLPEELSSAIYSGELSKKVKSSIRQWESEQAIHALNPLASVRSFQLPFYDALDYALSDADVEIVTKALRGIAAEGEGGLPVVILIPFSEDRHPAHRATHKLIQRCMQELSLKGKVVVGEYATPWTGLWNLYHYSKKNGNRLTALVGRELIVGKGKRAIAESELSGKLAGRYHLFRYNLSR